jgi:hypothetical protein
VDRFRRPLLVLAALAVVGLPGAADATRTALPRAFAPGDVFTAGTGGTIKWYDANGAFVADLHTGLSSISTIASDHGRVWAANAGGGVASELASIDGTTGAVTLVSPAGQTISPSWITFDRAGNVYLGDYEVDGKVSKFTPAGGFLGAVIAMESDFIDLAPDQCTMFLQRPGFNDSATERWNACTGTMIDTFHDPVSGAETARGVRLLPGGAVLIKNGAVQRLSASAAVEKVYAFPECGQLGTPQALDAAGTSFYADCPGVGVYEVDLATGARIRTLDLATPLTVLGEFRASAASTFAFRGFFAPIDNPPVVNLASAGRSIPVPFSLGGNRGLSIFAAGFPRTERIACDPRAPTDRVELTLPAFKLPLVYLAPLDTYVYTLTASRGWRGECRALVLRLRDGSEHRALFRFT